MMAYDERYLQRERAIDLVNEIGVDLAWKRPDVSITCYETARRMRAENDRLAMVIARLAAGI